MLEEINAQLDGTIAETGRALREMQEKGASEEQSVGTLMGSFVAAAGLYNPADGAVAYAVSLWRLTKQQTELAELKDRVDFLESAIRNMNSWDTEL